MEIMINQYLEYKNTNQLINISSTVQHPNQYLKYKNTNQLINISTTAQHSLS